MKLFGAVLSILLASLTAAPQPAAAEQPTNRGTVGELVRKLVGHRSKASIKPKVIGIDSADSSFLFAAAGSVEGVGGTFFRSDVMIFNFRSTSQRIALAWMAQGVDNTDGPVVYITLDANAAAVLPDFVPATLGQTGLGAVLISGVTSTGDPDDQALLGGTSRIWTPQPGASGSVSQTFTSVSTLDSLGGATAYALGNRHDAAFRTNVGIVNLDTEPHDWTVGVDGPLGDTTFTVSVLPMSMRQVPVPAGTYGDIFITFDSTGFDFGWSAYGASVDNDTGDSWSSHAAQP